MANNNESNSNSESNSPETKPGVETRRGEGLVKELPILATSILGTALIALGIGFSQPVGEQSKLQYTGDLWCVSNWVEERPYRQLPDGRPAKDPRLVGKEDWIVREQVAAKTKDEAEAKARENSHGSFEPSDADALRGYLDQNNKDAFTSYFNTGATAPGPCMGTGDTSVQTGKWLSDIIREICFGITGVSGERKDPYNPTAFTADQINQYLAQKYPKSPLAGLGAAFVEAAQKNNVNPGFLLGMANAETSLGSGPAVGSYSLFNIGDVRNARNYSSFEESISDGAKLLGSDSYRKLQGAHEIRLKWCGYEGESESSGATISDGSVIHYLCANGNSKWEDEVNIVLDEMIAMFPDSGAATDATPELLPNAPEWCPTTPPAVGPSSGEDYRQQIAQKFAEEMNKRGRGGATSGEALGFFDRLLAAMPGTLPPAANNIVKVAQGEIGYAANDNCAKYNAYEINGTRCWAWCAAFVTWVYNKAGLNIERSGGTVRLMELFQNGHSFIKTAGGTGYKPMAGDVFWMKANNSSGYHVGIVETVIGNTVFTIEGNVTGDVVARRRHGLGEFYAFGRW
ncbi:MAG: CHAP domain-containing protein [Candidatus Berkelbacteria bacterium]|nr:CHAP domain-containing protein [Candidatus Berkelbacteria bacterium]